MATHFVAYVNSLNKGIGGQKRAELVDSAPYFLFRGVYLAKIVSSCASKSSVGSL